MGHSGPCGEEERRPGQGRAPLPPSPNRTRRGGVTSQIFNLECYTLDHHCISYLFAFWVDPRNSTQLKDPRRELGILLFSYLSFLKF